MNLFLYLCLLIGTASSVNSINTDGPTPISDAISLASFGGIVGFLIYHIF